MGKRRRAHLLLSGDSWISDGVADKKADVKSVLQDAYTAHVMFGNEIDAGPDSVDSEWAEFPQLAAQVVEQFLESGILTFEMRIDRKDRKSTRLNSSHIQKSRMPSSA